MIRRALALSAGDNYVRLVINFATLAIVSRVLSPTEVGISVLGLGIMSIVLGLREFATPDFLIQRPDVSSREVRASFTVVLLFTCSIVLAVFVFSPWIAQFYREPRLETFLCICAIAALLESLSLPITGLLRREMRFGTLALISVAAASVMAMGTILLALSGLSFMSFAWASLAAASTTSLLSIWVRPNWSDFRPDLGAWRDVLSFGSYNGLTHVISQMYDTLPQLVLGGILPASSVAMYNRAVLLAHVPQRVFLTSVFSVAFPALAAEIRKGKDLKSAYLQGLTLITVLYWPSLALIAILAPTLVLMILGPQWLGVSSLLRIIAVAHLAWFPVILTGPVLLAMGANRDRVLVHLVARPVSAVVLCYAAYFGVNEMAAAQLVLVPYLMMVTFLIVKRHVRFEWPEIGRAIQESAIVTVASAAGPITVLFFSGLASHMSMLSLLLALTSFATGWLASVAVTKHPIGREILRATDAVRRVLSGPAEPQS